jgi:hypothetical protein
MSFRFNTAIFFVLSFWLPFLGWALSMPMPPLAFDGVRIAKATKMEAVNIRIVHVSHMELGLLSSFHGQAPAMLKHSPIVEDAVEPCDEEEFVEEHLPCDELKLEEETPTLPACIVEETQTVTVTERVKATVTATKVEWVEVTATETITVTEYVAEPTPQPYQVEYGAGLGQQVMHF